jgi:hypothetical protein
MKELIKQYANSDTFARTTSSRVFSTTTRRAHEDTSVEGMAHGPMPTL